MLLEYGRTEKVTSASAHELEKKVFCFAPGTDACEGVRFSQDVASRLIGLIFTFRGMLLTGIL